MMVSLYLLYRMSMSARENVAPAQGGPTPKGGEGFPCRYWQPVLNYKKS